MKITCTTIFSALGAALLITSPVYASPQPVSADYGTFGANDDGDLDHPSFGVMSDGEEYLFDVITHAKFCAKDSDFICIWGSIFNLAVPRHELSPTEQWKFGGYSFAVLRHQTAHSPEPPPPEDKLYAAKRHASLLGDDFDYYVIAARKESDKERCLAVYLFSPARGLVGVIYPACQGRLSTYNYLAEHDGPGSVPFDAKIPASGFLSQKELAALSTPK